jgi:hypothetical protein
VEILFTKVLDKAPQLHTTALHFRHVNNHSGGIKLKTYKMCGLARKGTRVMDKGGEWWR